MRQDKINPTHTGRLLPHAMEFGLSPKGHGQSLADSEQDRDHIKANYFT